MQKRKCKRCGKLLQKQKKYCSNHCKAIDNAKQARLETRICQTCKMEFVVKWFSPSITCSRKCGNVIGGLKRTGRIVSEQTKEKISKAHKSLLQRNPEQAKKLYQLRSERMIENNPMMKKVTRKKAITTKRIKGTLHVWKGERGGNGKLTESQIILAAALKWPTEVSIATGHYSGENGFPTNYKVDIGNRRLKLAIEVDGKGHLLKKAQLRDKKKETKLKLLGWSVLRFTNEDIMNNLSTVLSEIKKKIKTL